MGTTTGTLAHGTPEWHEARKTRVGASEVATLFGRNPYETTATMWARKKGLIPPVEVTEAMDRGNELEDGVARLFAKKYGIPVVRDQEAIFHGPLIVTGDYRTADAGEPVEIKTAPNGWSDHWQLQLQCQMMATGSSSGWIAWLDGDQVVHGRKFAADPALQADILWTAREFVESTLPLDTWDGPTGDPALRAAISPATPDEELELDPATALAVAELKAVTATRLSAGKREDELKAQIADTLRTATAGTVGGQVVVTWRQAKSSTRFDAKGFAAAHPAAVAEWTIEIQGARRMIAK